MDPGFVNGHKGASKKHICIRREGVWQMRMLLLIYTLNGSKFANAGESLFND